MSDELDSDTCQASHCSCPQPSLDRRQFIKLAALTAAAAADFHGAAVAGPFTMGDFETLVPADKKLSAQWLQSLTARGTPAVYQGEELRYIGMPVGGLCAG